MGTCLQNRDILLSCISETALIAEQPIMLPTKTTMATRARRMTIKNEWKVGRSRVRRHNYIDPLCDSLLLELTVLECSKLRIIYPATLSAGPHDGQRFNRRMLVRYFGKQFARLSEQFVESVASGANTVHGWFR